MFRRLISVSFAVALVLLISAATYFSVTYLFSPAEKPVSTVFQQLVRNGKYEDVLIKPGTIVRIEKKYACGDVMTEFQGPATKELQGLTRSEVRELYPADSGWEIHELSGGIVALSKSVQDLCEMHGQYRHLGVYQDMLAVYQGPLGYNDSLIRVEKNIPLSNLPPAFQVKLQQAMDFDKQAASTKLELRKQLEFPSEQLLNTALDSIDEMN